MYDDEGPEPDIDYNVMAPPVGNAVVAANMPPADVKPLGPPRRPPTGIRKRSLRGIVDHVACCALMREGKARKRARRFEMEKLAAASALEDAPMAPVHERGVMDVVSKLRTKTFERRRERRAARERGLGWTAAAMVRLVFSQLANCSLAAAALAHQVSKTTVRRSLQVVASIGLSIQWQILRRASEQDLGLFRQ